MAKASRSFCQLDLAPLLEATASESWTQAMREHALGCPCCALRLGAIDRLSARLGALPGNVGAPVGADRGRSGRLARLVWSPIKRTAALAAAGVVAACLALAAGHGLGPGTPLLWTAALADGAAAARSGLARGAGEDRARELATHGSPTPLPPIPFPAN
jgi:hypothetical protein